MVFLVIQADSTTAFHEVSVGREKPTTIEAGIMCYTMAKYHQLHGKVMTGGLSQFAGNSIKHNLAGML